jgi:hypothetical protein
MTSNKEQSPETYLGTDRRTNYKASPTELTLNQWTLEPGPSGTTRVQDSWQQDGDSVLAKG